MTSKLVYDSNDESETNWFGTQLAQSLEPGTIVGLVGELGAGKTRIAQAVAVEMGVDRRAVSSPTFVLVHEYEGRLPIFHLDMYRLKSIDEFWDLGAEEFLSHDGVCVIEWADRVADALPPQNVLWIQILILGENKRRFEIESNGTLSTRVLGALAKRLRQVDRECNSER
jgi:tRNA threonylcarbamoyladenosine biosynthesis protein TsaE